MAAPPKHPAAVKNQGAKEHLEAPWHGGDHLGLQVTLASPLPRSEKWPA